MLILLNGRGIFNGKVSTERDRVIIGISDIAQVFSLAGGTTPLAGIDVIEVTSATDIPYTLVMPRTFRQGSAGETDIGYSQLFRPTEHFPEETFGGIVTVTVIEQEFLPVEVVKGQTAQMGYIGIIFGDLVLESQIRDNTFVTVIDGYLQFIDGIICLMCGWLGSPITSGHILQGIRGRFGDTQVMNQFAADLYHVQIFTMSFPAGYFFQIGRIVHNDNGIFGRKVFHQDAFLLITQAIARNRTGILRARCQ